MCSRLWLLVKPSGPSGLCNGGTGKPRGQCRRSSCFLPRIVKRLNGLRSVAGVNNSAQLGIIVDEASGLQCLLDSGSQVSLWPDTYNRMLPAPTSPSFVKLIAANGTAIPTWGSVKLQIKIVGRFYTQVFIIAKVHKPILGFDFLKKYQMILDCQHMTLIHSNLTTPFIYTKERSRQINIVRRVCNSDKSMKGTFFPPTTP